MNTSKQLKSEFARYQSNRCSSRWYRRWWYRGGRGYGSRKQPTRDAVSRPVPDYQCWLPRVRSVLVLGSRCELDPRCVARIGHRGGTRYCDTRRRIPRISTVPTDHYAGTPRRADRGDECGRALGCCVRVAMDTAGRAPAPVDSPRGWTVNLNGVPPLQNLPGGTIARSLFAVIGTTL